MSIQADRLYVGDTLIWDQAAGGGEVTVELTVTAGVGQVEVPAMAVTRISGDQPVRVRLHSTEAGRDVDLRRSTFSRYPGGRCLEVEVNAVSPTWAFDVHAFVRGPVVFWAADGPATVILTGRSL